MNTINIEFLRKRFEKVLGYYGDKGLAPENSFIRIEQALINGQGVYRFDLKKENLSVTEQNLKRNDLFVCTHIGMFLSIVDPTKPGIESLLPFALLANEEAGIDGFVTSDINALYNGHLYVSTGSTVNIEDMTTALFKHVPNRQPALSGGITNQAQIEFDLMEVLHALPEELVFAGTQDHKVEVTFPTYAASNYAGSVEGSQTKVIFFAYGYKVPGGTAEQYKNDTSNPYRYAI